jgi:ribonuclease HI
VVLNVTATFLYTDGACLGNPGPGGWAYILVTEQGEIEASGGEPGTTNNKMELIGAIEGLAATPLGSDVVVLTDSEYLRNGMQTWTKTWQRNGWRTSAGGAVKNKELWQALLELSARRRVRWHWVRGHVPAELGGDALNHRCDELARAAAREVAALARAPSALGD